MSSGRSVTGRAKPCYCLTTDGFGRTAEQARGQNGWILAKLLFCLLRRTNTIKTLIINRMFSLRYCSLLGTDNTKKSPSIISRQIEVTILHERNIMCNI